MILICVNLCREGLGAGGEGDDRGWDGWMASPTRWMWVWVHSGSWWWTGRPGVLQFMVSQRVGHNWATELNRCRKMQLCFNSCNSNYYNSFVWCHLFHILRRNGVAIMVNKSLKCSTWMQSLKRQNNLCSFPMQTLQYHSNQSLCPNQ